MEGNSTFEDKDRQTKPRRPKFFRVSAADEFSFPEHTFSSLGLYKVEVRKAADNDKSKKDIDIKISWSVSRNFYYTEYDWSIIYRRIGDTKNPNMFYKTKYSLNNHMKVELGEKENWSPKSENLTGMVKMMPDTFYEICLSVVDEEAILYYIHSNHCAEIRTPKVYVPPPLKTDLATTPSAVIQLNSYHDKIQTTNISVASTNDSITVIC